MVPEPWGGADALTRDRRIAEDNLADCPLSTAYGEGSGIDVASMLEREVSGDCGSYHRHGYGA